MAGLWMVFGLMLSVVYANNDLYFVHVRVSNLMKNPPEEVAFVSVPFTPSHGSLMSAELAFNLSKIPYESIYTKNKLFVFDIQGIPCKYQPVVCWFSSVNNSTEEFNIAELFLNNGDEIDWKFYEGKNV